MIAAPRLTESWRRRHRQLSRAGDAGTSMIELFVAMIIMTICGSIFTGAIVTLFKAANQAQAITTSSQQGNQAYQSLDRRVRYAAAISQPAKSSGSGTTGDWYVELRNTTDGTERCSQLRLDISSGQLQRRTWQVSSSGTATALTAFVPLASGLTNASTSSTSTDRPFILRSKTDVAPLIPLPATAQHQVLIFTLISKAGVANQPVSSRSRFELTALNSTYPVAAGPICQQVPRP